MLALTAWLQALQQTGFVEDEVERALQEADTDHDGLVDFMEFVQMMRNFD
jgi:Ca2+-binding EF-hand superfamily protein